jgi:integrase/recombinase XerD
VSEVVRLRPCDVDVHEGALMLENRKQKRGGRRKRVYVSHDLVAQLLLAKERRVGYRGFLFGSAKSGDRPMSTVHAWRIVTACSRRAGVHIEAADGLLRPANGRDFRHGAAVNQVQQGVPLSEVQRQLGHARIDSTTIYTKLANPERRRVTDRVAW